MAQSRSACLLLWGFVGVCFWNWRGVSSEVMARHCETLREVEIVCVSFAFIQASQMLMLEDLYGTLPSTRNLLRLLNLIASANDGISVLMSRAPNNEH